MKAIQLLRQGLLLTLLAALLAMPVGCGDGDGGKDDGPGAYEPAEPAATPTAAIERLFDAWNDNKPALAWDALPESYQKDVTDLVHSFAEKMEPHKDLYDKAMTIASKAAEVLETKNDMLATMLTKQGMKDVDASALEGIGDAISTVVDSDIATIDGLKEVNIGEYVHETGSRLLPKIKDLIKMAPEPEAREMLTKMEKATVKLISEEGDTAVVEVSTEGEEPEKIKMKKVEGKWIPADMADGWDEMIKEAKQGLEEMSTEDLKRQKPEMMGGLTLIEGILDNMNNAQNQEQFEQAASQLMGMVMGGMGGGSDGFDKSSPKSIDKGDFKDFSKDAKN